MYFSISSFFEGIRVVTPSEAFKQALFFQFSSGILKTRVNLLFIDMSLCLACEYSRFTLALFFAARGRFALAATQVQQFNRVGVATTLVGKRGRIDIECIEEKKMQLL